MKFIIAKSTVAQLDTSVAEIIATVAAEFGGELGNPGNGVSDAIDLSDIYKNHSVKVVDADYVFEISDEAAHRVISIYLKIAKYVMPFVRAFQGLIHLVKDETLSFEEFMHEKK